MVTRLIVLVLLAVVLVGPAAIGQQPAPPPPPPPDFTVKVAAPNGGEKWIMSTTQTVFWELGSTVAPDSIQIRLTWIVTDTDQKESRLLTTIRKENPGKWEWEKVGPAGDGMKIQVEAFFPEKMRVSDVSDDFFAIVAEEVPPAEAAVVKILSPNGGEIWMARSTETVQWEVQSLTEPDSIRIRLTQKAAEATRQGLSARKEGRLLTTIRGDNPGKWEWDKVGPVGDGMKIQVEAFLPDKKKVSDVSDDFFAIVAQELSEAMVAPACRTLSPNGGESWKVGSKHLIKWTARSARPKGASGAEGAQKFARVTEVVRISLSRDGGTMWEVVADGLKLASSEWEWTVPKAVSDKCRLKIALLDEKLSEVCKDESDADFRIITSDVTVPRDEVPGN